MIAHVLILGDCILPEAPISEKSAAMRRSNASGVTPNSQR